MKKVKIKVFIMLAVIAVITSITSNLGIYAKARAITTQSLGLSGSVAAFNGEYISPEVNKTVYGPQYIKNISTEKNRDLDLRMMHYDNNAGTFKYSTDWITIRTGTNITTVNGQLYQPNTAGRNYVIFIDGRVIYTNSTSFNATWQLY
ncbi:MAG: hypothetical protein RR988_03750 [Clostridia bacterium]